MFRTGGVGGLPFNPAAVAITGGNVPQVSKSGIPYISLPTGSMANNGAITLGTALPIIYLNGFWGALPAGAIAAGIPAAETIYWVVMSSTTVGTVFNSIYTTGMPGPGVQTAFVTTGPGAYTGTTTENGYFLPIAANSLGNNGAWRLEEKALNNNSGGTKTINVRYSGIGGTQIATFGNTTNTDSVVMARATNLNGTARQESYASVILGGSTAMAGQRLSVNTTAGTTVAMTVQKGTATDYIIIPSFVFEQMNDGT